MTLKEYLKEIENWLKDYLANSPCKAFVLGISGGVDSTLVAAIAKNAVGKENLFCYALPIDSNPKDVEDALKVKDALDLNMEVIDLTETYKSYIKEFKDDFKGYAIQSKYLLFLHFFYNNIISISINFVNYIFC